MSGRLDGKVVLICGAGPNMGRAVSILFAQEGARVVLAGRRRQPLDETAAFVGRHGGTAAVVEGDMTDEADVLRAVAVARERFGRLDALYHNVGGGYSTEHDVTRMSLDFFEAALRNNLRSFHLLVKHSVPLLEESGGGAIITVAGAWKVRQDANSAYAAAKAGLIGSARNLARELYPRNIRVHVLAPSLVWEAFELGPIVPATRKLDRLGHAADVAYAALYLCSDEAAWVTGLVLDVDGGDHILASSPLRQAAVERGYP